MKASEFYTLLNSEKERVKNFSEDEIVRDEIFWKVVSKAYTISPGLLNMNNGGVSPQSIPVQEAFIEKYKICNQGPTYFMWKVLEEAREPLRARLARFINAGPEEVCINRNTSEALDTIINGLPLNEGDEVVLSQFDYPSMIYTWKLREQRDKIKLKWISLDLPENNITDLIDKYRRAFTDRTKVVLLPHIINWNGQIMPVKEICAEARKRNILSMIDAAHSIANLDLDVKDLGCDFLGSSLHKWLGAPFGTGLLYCRKEHIAGIPPMFANEAPYSDNIRKFEWLGTRNFAAEYAIMDALDFHESLGTSLKRKRLSWLRDLFIEKASTLNLKFVSPLTGSWASNLVTFSVGDNDPLELEKRLLEKNITIAAFDWEGLKGIRVTPHIYSSAEDISRFVKELRSLQQSADKPF